MCKKGKGHSCRDFLGMFFIPKTRKKERDDTMTGQYKIKELYKILGSLIDDGYGDKEFQLYYDAEVVYTTIPKGSKIEINDEGVRFTDYDDGVCHIDDLEEILND